MYEYFERLIDPLRPTPVQRPPAATAAFIWYHLRPHRRVIIAALVLSGIAGLIELWMFAFLGVLIDWMDQTPAADFWPRHGTALLAMVVLAGLVRPLVTVAGRAVITLALVPGLANATRWQNHRYVLSQSITFFQNDFAGRVSQKVMQTGNALREVVLNVVDGLWLLIIYLVGITVLFLDINPRLLIPVALWSLGYAGVVWWLVPPVRGKSAQLSEATSALTGRVVDSYTNIQSVKLFAHHPLEENYAAEGIQRHTRAFHVLMRAILNMTLVLQLLNGALMIGMAWLSIVLWQNQTITTGQIAMANGLIIRLNHMSGWILRTITSLFEQVGTVQNGVDTIARPLLVRDTPDARDLQVSDGVVSFEQVSFHYAAPAPDRSLGPGYSGRPEGEPTGVRPASEVVIKDCSFRISAGEKVGLVGRSGAGKSTLINLLMRFHDVQGGAVRIDGQDVRQVTQQSLRSSIAVVTQDTSLLHRSIADNIRYGRAEASDEEVVAAAELAEAMSFIPQLTDPQGRQGLAALVGERGVKLSGGQRQRIAIARVILKDAPILVLDEATSALDSEVEAAIQQQLERLMRGKTVIAVAHRLSTIAALDRLIVLDQGGVVETGTHARLLGTGGLYARLWHRQSGGFIGV